ncbi:MAG: hypothetical protein QOJ64_859 [Acidobacteriota bacterium]|nr:hypothetical protein [Acidobacteriota bacterium]
MDRKMFPVTLFCFLVDRYHSINTPQSGGFTQTVILILPVASWGTPFGKSVFNLLKLSSRIASLNDSLAVQRLGSGWRR